MTRRAVRCPVLVNFPNAEGYPIASSPDQFLGPRTAALIVILSRDVSPLWSGKSSPTFKIDLEVICRLLSASSTPAKSRLFAVIIDEGAASRIKGMWLSSLQCVTDNAIAREELLTTLAQAHPR